MALTKVIGRGLGVQGDTVTGDDAALGFTSAEGLIITGQGSTNDVTIKNDADTQVCGVPTGTDDLRFPDNAQLQLGTGGDFKIYHDATNNNILGNGSHPMRFYTNDTLALKIDTNGIITKPLQPAFFVQRSATQSNISNAAGHVTVTFDTEIFDQNADFASNTFTAPVTGRYQLNLSLRVNSLDTGANYYQVFMRTSNREIYVTHDPNYTADLSYHQFSFGVLADMDASDTAYVSIVQSGGTAQTDVMGGGDTSFSGYLVA